MCSPRGSILHAAIGAQFRHLVWRRALSQRRDALPLLIGTSIGVTLVPGSKLSRTLLLNCEAFRNFTLEGLRFNKSSLYTSRTDVNNCNQI